MRPSGSQMMDSAPLFKLAGRAIAHRAASLARCTGDSSSASPKSHGPVLARDTGKAPRPARLVRKPGGAGGPHETSKICRRPVRPPFQANNDPNGRPGRARSAPVPQGLLRIGALAFVACPPRALGRYVEAIRASRRRRIRPVTGWTGSPDDSRKWVLRGGRSGGPAYRPITGKAWPEPSRVKPTRRSVGEGWFLWAKQDHRA
jgi:hypothetical protein